jgi:IS605 OrfB family transposase
MKLTLQIQVLPSVEQRQYLLDTIQAFNDAASYAAKIGFEAGVFSQPSIHKRCYQELRSRFGLSSQMAVRAIGKAVRCFSRDKKKCPKFKPYGAMTYDERLMGFKGLDKVSLLTLVGRQLIPIIFGNYQRERFDRLKGQCDLVYRNNKFYLYCSLDFPEEPPCEIHEFLGVDLGVENLATTSDGQFFTGKVVEQVRQKYHRTRQKLQQKTSGQYKRRSRKNARRVLKRIGNRESRFRRHVNHVISKQLVLLAKDTGRGIALEKLTGIRDRARFRREQRAKMGSWAFAQLRQFVEYKAKMRGVVISIVDPRNTSRKCSVCGHCEKANRQNQAEFYCLECGHTAHADHNAAINIAALAACKPAIEVSQRHLIFSVA